MKRHLVRFAVAALLLLIPVSAPAQKALTQTVYAHVTNSSGEPIADLAPANFLVSQGGEPANVLRASFGSDTVRVLLLVDTSETMSNKLINPLRAGLQALIDGIPPENEIVLATMGRQMRVRVQATLDRKDPQAATDRKKLKDTAGSFFSDGGGTVLLDSLAETYDRFLAKADDRAPVIVIVTTDGPETSTSTREDEFSKLVQALVARDAVVHAIVLSDTTKAITGSSSSAGTQSVVTMHLTQSTGGHFETIHSATALADRLQVVSAEIRAAQEAASAWYQIDYTTSAAVSRKPIDVEVRRPDVKVELSSKRPRKASTGQTIK
jgi:VWFA-related protein